MKKILTLFMICSLILMTGCGGSQSGDDSKKDSDAGKIKIGMITRLNASEENFGVFMKKIEDTLDVKISSHVPVFFDNLNQMQMALQSNQIDEISTYRSVARYMIAKDPRYQVLKDHSLEFVDTFCFALRDDEEELRDSLNTVIKEMQSDGTLDRLTKEYITDINVESEPPAIEIPKFENAQTIKVAVTGDLPPLDYVSADGKPAGFNTAVLAEIGNRMLKNIELVQIDSGARAAALTSKQVDVVFWAIVPVSEIIPEDSDKPDGIILTEPYFRDKIVHMVFKAGK
ncbi:MAG: transporter substrate-binding domain-containing protein [Selenomonadaceae bacterium]|nr:transporter substrate-binding domain-containing protein [Selenomonadaceae bacterium]